MPVGSRGNILSPSRYGLGNGAFRAGKRRLASVGRRRAARFSGSPGGGEVSPSSSSVRVWRVPERAGGRRELQLCAAAR